MCTFSESVSKVFPASFAMDMKFALSVALGSDCGCSSSQMMWDEGMLVQPGERLMCSSNVLAHLSHLSSLVSRPGLAVVSISDAFWMN